MKRRSSARTNFAIGSGGGRGRRVDRLGRVDDAVAVGAGLDRVRPLQRDGELGRDVAVAPLARHPDDRRDRDAGAAPLDVLLLREQRGLDALRRLGAPRVEGAQALLRGGPALVDLLELRLRRRLRVPERLALRVERPLDVLRLGRERLELLGLRVVRLLGDVDLAGEGGVLARRADLAEPALPLLHLVPLHPEERLELPPLALVRVETPLRVVVGTPRLEAARLRLRPACRERLDLPAHLVGVEIDLLQLLERLQLLTQRRQWFRSSCRSLWAHQDPYLDRIGYEPAALTVV